MAHVGDRIASALDYAYERASVDGTKLRLVHRDISPHNVLLDTAGTVRLSDFGVARTAVQDHKSRYGTVRGKPSYMAPEQVLSLKIDARTDVFALGILLYESACVKRLFGRGNPIDSMKAVTQDTPKPLTQRIPGFPADLWGVIEKALQKDPNDRWQSAAEFSSALAEVARALPGSVTVNRDLGELIDELFEPGSFDADAKAQQALSALEQTVGQQAATHTEEGTEPGGDPTAPGEDDVEHTLPAAFSEKLQTDIGWGPGRFNPDPLDPDAIADEARRYAEQRLVPPAPPPSSRALLAVVVVLAVVSVVALWLVMDASDVLERRTGDPFDPLGSVAIAGVRGRPGNARRRWSSGRRRARCRGPRRREAAEEG